MRSKGGAPKGVDGPVLSDFFSIKRGIATGANEFFVLPRTREDVIGMGRSFAKTTFLSAGNITHDPAYGNLIALGVLTAVEAQNAAPQQADNVLAYRAMIARTGRFITYCGGAPIIGQRLRPDPADRVALKLVRETDAGVVISGRLVYAWEFISEPLNAAIERSMIGKTVGWSVEPGSPAGAATPAITRRAQDRRLCRYKHHLSLQAGYHPVARCGGA